MKHISWPQKKTLLWIVLLVLVLSWSLFLLIYRLTELMPFLGDQAWFYLSARDIWLKGEIPLVGITSSHTWLHQGPLWTYILAVILPIAKWNPIAPAYFTVFTTLLTGILMGVIGGRIFSVKVGIIAAILYSLSPLVIIHGRMPYHTTLIPLFSLLFFFSLYQWVKGAKVFFPLTIYFLGVLYNFELATLVLWGPLILLILYGIIKHLPWRVTLKDKKLLLLSVLAFVLPMLPILLYDTTHGFKQTVVFLGWTIYHLIPGTSHTDSSYRDVFNFLLRVNGELLYGYSKEFSLALLALCTGITTFFVIRKRELSETLLLLTFSIILVALIMSKTPSDAYLPMLFPFVIFMVSVALGKIITDIPSAVLVAILLLGITIGNTQYLLTNEYLLKTNRAYSSSLTYRENTVKYMLRLSNCEPFSFTLKGLGSQFVSSRMPVQYLSWYYGREAVPKQTKNHFIITEKGNTVDIVKK